MVLVQCCVMLCCVALRWVVDDVLCYMLLYAGVLIGVLRRCDVLCCVMVYDVVCCVMRCVVRCYVIWRCYAS